MKYLGYSSDNTINSVLDAAEFDGWDVRTAVRAVLYDAQGQIALMHAAKMGYYKLPGGGVDHGEDLMLAMARELKEETGCTAKVTDSIGMYLEKRSEWKMIQVSHCYKALVAGYGQNELTQDEADEGFELVWAKDLAHALQLVQGSSATTYDQKFMTQRDAAILSSIG